MNGWMPYFYLNMFFGVIIYLNIFHLEKKNRLIVFITNKSSKMIKQNEFLFHGIEEL